MTKKTQGSHMPESVARWMAGQLGKPHGWFGRLFLLRMLNRGNRELIAAAVDALALGPEDRFLDVGFGGGLSLELAAGRGVTRIFGVDPSDAAVARLRGRRPSWARGTTLTIEKGAVERLPLGDGEIDAIASTNTVYFWPDLDAPFRELHRVLAPGGRLALGFSTAERMREIEHITRHGFTLHENDAIAAAAFEAGFSRAELVALHGGSVEGEYLLRATAG